MIESEYKKFLSGGVTAPKTSTVHQDLKKKKLKGFGKQQPPLLRKMGTRLLKISRLFCFIFRGNTKFKKKKTCWRPILQQCLVAGFLETLLSILEHGIK